MCLEPFFSGYHWTVDQALNLTMPQIVMISHASWVNAKKSGLLDKTKNNADASPESYKSDDVPMWKGKRIDELTTEQYQAYLNEL